MVFSSIYFLWCFLPIAIIGYFLIIKEYQNAFLLIASIYFYAWGNPRATLLLLFSILLNFLLVLLMDKCNKMRRAALIVIILLNVGILFHYKYAEFFFNGIFKLNLNMENRLLPIGISFYTFQILSYAIEVYQKNTAALTNICDMGLYVAFFPKLVQGPIVKYTDFAPQLKSRNITSEKFYDGIKRFIIGLGKKTLVANVLGGVTDNIFILPVEQLSTPLTWLGAFCYTLQIYYDFSGYSDMAIGIGKLFGFEFKENFNYPYTATSIKDFWRKWHISLSSWFRDYIYIPLGGNRKGKFRTCLNIFMVFVVTGVWHGANWTFWLWGIWHGIIQIAESLIWGKWLKKAKIVNVLYTDMIVLIGWVLFRADNIQYALRFLKNMFIYKAAVPNYTFINYVNLKVIIVIIGAAIFSGIAQHFSSGLAKRTENSLLLKTGEIFLLIVILFLSLMSIASGAYNPFIYFKF